MQTMFQVVGRIMSPLNILNVCQKYSYCNVTIVNLPHLLPLPSPQLNTLLKLYTLLTPLWLFCFYLHFPEIFKLMGAASVERSFMVR